MKKEGLFWIYYHDTILCKNVNLGYSEGDAHAFGAAGAAAFLATFFGAAFLAWAFFGCAAFLAWTFFGAAFLAWAFFGAAFLAWAFFTWATALAIERKNLSKLFQEGRVTNQYNQSSNVWHFMIDAIGVALGRPGSLRSGLMSHITILVSWDFKPIIEWDELTHFDCSFRK